MVTFIKKYAIPISIFVLVVVVLCFVSRTYAIENTFRYTKKINLGSEELEINYSSTVKDINNISLYEYKDIEGNQYIYKNNEIVGFLKNKSYKEANSDKKSMIKYSVDDLEKEPLLSNINFKNYVLDNVQYFEDYNETIYTFSKYINDIKTNDGIYVSFDNDGTLASFAASRQGLFDNIETKITSNDVKKYVEEVVKKEYNVKEYNIDYMYIDYQDSKYVVYCVVGLQYDNYRTTAEILYEL